MEGSLEVLGHIDLISPSIIEGWLFSPTTPEHKFSMSIYAGTEIIDHVTADIYREDLHNCGYGDGHVAFHYSPQVILPAELLKDIRIRLAYSNVYLLPDEVTRIEGVEEPEEGAGEELPELE